MWRSVQNNITAAGDNPIGAVNSGMDAAIGPSFDYLQTIRSPADRGVSSNGTFNQVFTNANAISGYVNSLLTGPKVGNQFFRDTGGKCKAPSGRIVNRSTWNNNKLGGDDAAGVLGPSFQRAVSGSGFDGIIPGAAGDIAAMNPLKVMNALVLDGIPECQAFSCPVTDEVTGVDKGRDTKFLTPSLEFNLTGCRPVAEPPADEAFDTVEAPFLHSQYSPRKLVNTDSGPFIMLGLAIATLVVLKIMS